MAGAAQEPSVFEVPAGPVVVGLDLAGGAHAPAAVAASVPTQQQRGPEPALLLAVAPVGAVRVGVGGVLRAGLQLAAADDGADVRELSRPPGHRQQWWSEEQAAQRRTFVSPGWE